MTNLKYADLYQLTEELQKFQGAQFQGVSQSNPLRFVFEVRMSGETRLLIIDLSPAQPFIVSTSFTKTKSMAKKTPVLNFLKAHFINLRIEKFEIAQKPNRTIKMLFLGPQNNKEIIFKCFPHGQHLILKSEGKVVNFPLRPQDPEDSLVSFIDPESTPSWEFNESLENIFLAKQSGPSAKAEPYHEKLIKKLERAAQSLEGGMQEQRPFNVEKIKALELEANRLSLEKYSGEEIQRIFSEIKKIQRKESVGAQRREDILKQIAELKRVGTSFSPVPKEPATKKEKLQFSGTRVRISEKWELWVGRTAWQNDDLLREASQHDLWIHLRDYPGAHGVLRGPKKSEPTVIQIELASRIVAILSQSKKKPFGEGEKLDFIITPKKFVKKRKGAATGRVTVERETVRRIAFKSVKFDVM
jgi:predicted ribosome quality control (RQC) complex YloA/Tae2 family protein